MPHIFVRIFIMLLRFGITKIRGKPFEYFSKKRKIYSRRTSRRYGNRLAMKEKTRDKSLLPCKKGFSLLFKDSDFPVQGVQPC